jgi:cytochrome c-type biogenesis protein CcmH
MALWAIFALLTAMAALAVLLPFWRARPSAAPGPNDLEVYKQQLQEIEEESARGLLGEAEAAAARVEISRRILAAAESPDALPKTKHRAITPYVLVALLPAVAVSLYLVYGSPTLPSQPFASRTPSGSDSIGTLVARVEERLQTHPEDGAGWNVIAPVYMRLGRYADAAEAYRNAAKILGDTADRAANLGEALTLANGGTIDPEARAAFEKALSLDPAQAKSQFWLGIAEEQAGQTAEAIAIYRRLLERQLPEAVAGAVRDRIAALEGAPASAEVEKPPLGGGVDAAQINQMVAGLAERLKKDGSDLKGWLMLVRAYTVLGRKDEALNALGRARGQFAGNSEALAEINALAKSLGLPS